MEVFLSATILALCLAPMALGIFLSMKIFNIPDITTDGSYTLGAVITAIMLTQNISLSLIAPTVLTFGAIAGFCTGFIHTKLNIDALLSGILVMTALYSVNLSILGTSNLPLIDKQNIFNTLTFTNNFSYNSLVIILIILVFITFLITYILKTDFGIAMRATGNNISMVRTMGINDKKLKNIGLAISNSLTAFSGFLITQNQFFADINMGTGIVITGLGTVLIADAIKQIFKINSLIIHLIIILISSIFFQSILAFTLSIGINPNYLKLTTSIFVLTIVISTKLRKNSN